MSFPLFISGAFRQWDAPSGYYHNITNTSQVRFLPEPDTPEPGVRGRSDSSASSRWYYWKLKPFEVTPWTRFLVWFCYIGHQLTIWATTYLAQLHNSTKTRKEKYSTRMNTFSWAALGLNMFFHLAHFVNTHTTYDSLAQDVSEASSQGSVIMLMNMVLVMEYSERGLIFGWPAPKHTGKWSQKLKLPYGPVNLMRKYHGYAFSWAAIYTFWYHPMENTYGHALGFFHTWIIMLQGSLMYTNLHLNRWWRFVLEAWVLLHGGLVAVQTSKPQDLSAALWPMFVFGFAFALALSWIFILPFWKKLPNWTTSFPIVLVTAIAVAAYSQIPDSQGRMFVRLQEVWRTPAIFYLFFFICYGLIALALFIEKKIHKGETPPPLSPTMRIVYLTGAFLNYFIMVLVSTLVEVYDWKVNLIVLMIVLLMLYSVGVIISSMLLKRIMQSGGPRNQTAPENNKVETITEKELPEIKT